VPESWHARTRGQITRFVASTANAARHRHFHPAWLVLHELAGCGESSNVVRRERPRSAAVAAHAGPGGTPPRSRAAPAECPQGSGAPAWPVFHAPPRDLLIIMSARRIRGVAAARHACDRLFWQKRMCHSLHRSAKPAWVKAASNPIANFDPRNAFADCCDLTGPIGQRHHTDLRWAAPAAFENHQIAVVERARTHLHQGRIELAPRLSGRIAER